MLGIRAFCLQMNKIQDYSLYLVLTESYAQGKDILSIAKAAIAGGIDILQMREKDKSHEELRNIGSELSRLCRDNGVPFIVNDDPELAKELNASGVHIGQSDLISHPIEEIRRTIGKDRLIGLSTHSLEQFKEANESDLDYISFGPIFPTKTKDYYIGTSEIKDVLKLALKPVIFIGGINTLNVDSLLGLGVRNIALIREIMQADDIVLKTREFKNKLKEREA